MAGVGVMMTALTATYAQDAKKDEAKTEGLQFTTVKAHILVCLVLVRVVDDEHLREVHLALARAEQLRLDKAYAGERPARTRAVLVLYRCNLQLLDGVWKASRWP